MRKKEISFLKIRCLEFWEEGNHLYKEKKYNLSIFNIEQALQLWIKYLIAKKVGDWPKTHYFSDLIKNLYEVYENEEIIKFYKEKELFFNNIEDAYFTTRYFPKQFSKNFASQIIENAKEFITLTEKITREKFSK
ncbi:MAG: HEPN domain-containing protein [Candidatus Ratteibacteria bacterium]